MEYVTAMSMKDLTKLINNGEFSKCRHCHSEYEDDDYAFALETGTCPYCHEIITNTKLKGEINYVRN